MGQCVCCLQPSLTKQGWTSPFLLLEISSPASCGFLTTQTAKDGAAELKRGSPDHTGGHLVKFAQVLTPSVISLFPWLPGMETASGLHLRMDRNSPVTMRIQKLLPASEELRVMGLKTSRLHNYNQIHLFLTSCQVLYLFGPHKTLGSSYYHLHFTDE